MNKNIKYLIYITLIFLATALFLLPKIEDKAQIPESTQNKVTNQAPQEDHSVKAYLKIENIKYEHKINNSNSVYDLMDMLREEKQISFTEKNYAGMGKLITSINDIKNSGSKNWIYYVNGEKMEIGVSAKKINYGDVVSWKYENFNY